MKKFILLALFVCALALCLVSCGNETTTVPFSQGLEFTLSEDGSFYILCGIGTCTDTEIVIPSKYKYLPVKEIGNNAFNASDWFKSHDEISRCAALTSIQIPDSVTKIGDKAFYDCDSVTSFTIPNSITSVGKGAFSNCSVLKYNEYSNCRYLGNEENPYYLLVEVLYKNYDGYKVHDDTRAISEFAFSGCTALTSIEIPGGVQNIGNRTFYGCTALTTVKMKRGVKSIENNAFEGCSGLTSIEIPSSVKGIGDNAFYNCKSLTSIEIPNSVKSIGNNAFGGCSGLTSIEIPNSVTSIGLFAFESCTALTSVIIGSGVTNISKWTFADCPNLASIEISSSVTSIEALAFDACESLSDVYYTGTEEQWSQIIISEYNTELNSAVIHYNYVP